MNFSLFELAGIAIALDEEERPGRKKRRWAVHPAWRKRNYEGEFITLYKELIHDEDKFFGYFRMNKESFLILLEKVNPLIKKQSTRFQTPISPMERLAVFLRFMATGDSFKTISYSYRQGHATIARIVSETSRAIVKTLIDEVMSKPTEEKWKSIAEDFWTTWNFPNCIGALDGKHFRIEAPANTGSMYFNYKKTFSIVLLALVDARYNFVMVDVGSLGRSSDGGIFSRSAMGKRLENGTLDIPIDNCLPGTNIKTPYVIVGDEAFPLKTYLMRPYPGRQSNGDAIVRQFNYRLSRARRISENAFGILVQKFRIFLRPIKLSPENADYIILSGCILHNFIRQRNSNFTNQAIAGNETINFDENLDALQTLGRLPLQGGRATENAFVVR